MTALEIFRAMADPTRMRIVALLRTMELSVGELAQVLGQSQPRVSRHIRILCDAGIARRRREGSWVFLQMGARGLTDPLLSAIDRWQAEGGEDHWVVADAARLAAVRADRAAAAERYFAAHAEQWDAMRALHIADSQVEAEMADMLAASTPELLVDIGTGTGRMLELFSGKAKRAVGIDRSPEMLRVARGNLTRAGVAGWELQQGDIMALPLAEASADTVILHQVLHFLQAPEAALEETGRVLAPGGRLLIADFAPHDLEELRSKEAHARLGFSDEQVSAWLAKAGLDLVESRALKGAPLTVKLWLAERPARPLPRIVAL